MRFSWPKLVKGAILASEPPGSGECQFNRPCTQSREEEITNEKPYNIYNIARSDGSDGNHSRDRSRRSHHSLHRRPIGGGDLLSRGFYITGYSATNLDTVTLYYDSSTAGTYMVSLTANLNAYNGTIIGSTQSATFNLAGGLGLGAEEAIVFDFAAAAVPLGSTITFTQNLISGPGTLFFDAGTPGPSGVTETNGTTPPLGHVPQGAGGDNDYGRHAGVRAGVPHDRLLCRRNGRSSSLPAIPGSAETVPALIPVCPVARSI
jgi:hypothetical protein